MPTNGACWRRLTPTKIFTTRKGSATANSAITTIVAPVVVITNKRPTLVIVSVRFSGATVYARFRICDDAPKNVTILATDSRPNVAPQTRRFTTLIPPRRGHEIIAAYTLAFFDRYSKGGESPLLRAASLDYPEVAFLRR